jgi:hypothetical protein
LADNEFSLGYWTYTDNYCEKHSQIIITRSVL